MTLDFRKAAVGLLAVGAVVGLAFGAGVAFGRGDPKTVETGLSAQEIQSMLGLTGGATTGAPGGQGGVGGGAAGGGLLANLLDGGTAGVITEVTSDSITVETAQGVTTFAISGNTVVEVLADVAASDLEVGAPVVVSGTSGDGGEATAAQITELPEALSGLATGGFGGGGGGGGGRQPGGNQTP